MRSTFAAVPRNPVAEVASRPATGGQEDVRFRAEALSASGDTGIARWRCSFRRRASGRTVDLDGILVARFDDAGLCTEFREWWHRAE